MIRVGAELKKVLEDAGVFVTHDVTAYEPPKLSTAYGRSLEGLKKAVEEGYDLYIDLHRDAYSEGKGPNTVSRDGKAIARVLFLIGKGDSFDGAFLAGLAEGRSIEQAALNATAAAALNTEAFGPMEGKISRVSVAKMIRTEVLCDVGSKL